MFICQFPITHLSRVVPRALTFGMSSWFLIAPMLHIGGGLGWEAGRVSWTAGEEVFGGTCTRLVEPPLN